MLGLFASNPNKFGTLTLASPLLTGGEGRAILGWQELEMSLTEQICKRARDLGFDLVGVASARPSPYSGAYRDWLAQGYHGEMGYMARAERVERRADPARILPGVHSIVCVGLNYYTGLAIETRFFPKNLVSAGLTHDPARGLISNYAWGLDYHDVMTPRLEELVAFIGSQAGRKVAARVYVDTGPVLERAYAAEAGLGFIGKNTCLIHPKMGSWLFLGEILLDLELEPTSQQANVGCGTCRRCLEACPTGALIAPYVLDARRCISYLTIELKGSIPRAFRPLMGNWIYGCDVCQVVCPWQRFARLTEERSFQAGGPGCTAPLLLDLVEMDEEMFRLRYAGTPIFRIGRHRLVRNVVVALGNWGDRRAVRALTKALGDPSPLVREHVAWALQNSKPDQDSHYHEGGG